MDPKNVVKHYPKDDITVVWDAAKCIHSTKCWKGEQGLPEVFNPMKKPWINVDGADAQRIIEQVKRCPSGALSLKAKVEL